MIKIKPEFRIEDYSEGAVMHCPTLDSAIIFCQFLHENGRRWHAGQSYVEVNYWNDSREDSCYEFLPGFYGDYDEYCDDEYYTILEFDDFDWSSFLEETDIEPSESITEFLSTFERI